MKDALRRKAGNEAARPEGVVIAMPSRAEPSSVSYNLNGQRLGRKGRDTRERIIAAARVLLAQPEPVPITLSAVAREASLNMTSLYLYFSDLTELLLAVLEPVMESAETAYVGLLRERWSDEELGERCRTFIMAYHAFWQEHTRLLHLRNSMADQHDLRMARHRIASGQLVIELLVGQMTCKTEEDVFLARHMAASLITGFERAVTLATDSFIRNVISLSDDSEDMARLSTVARILELGIRDRR
jgi:AcrR family transcriptional regulator